MPGILKEEEMDGWISGAQEILGAMKIILYNIVVGKYVALYICQNL